MTEKVEWEVVDDAASKQGTGPGTGHGPAPGPQAAMKLMLGPWWRWKLAGLVVVGVSALLLLLTLAGVFMVGMAAVALISLGVARLVHWLHGHRNRSLAVQPPHSGDWPR